MGQEGGGRDLQPGTIGGVYDALKKEVRETGLAEGVRKLVRRLELTDPFVGKLSRVPGEAVRLDMSYGLDGAPKSGSVLRAGVVRKTVDTLGESGAEVEQDENGLVLRGANGKVRTAIEEALLAMPTNRWRAALSRLVTSRVMSGAGGWSIINTEEMVGVCENELAVCFVNDVVKGTADVGDSDWSLGEAGGRSWEMVRCAPGAYVGRVRSEEGNDLVDYAVLVNREEMSGMGREGAFIDSRTCQSMVDVFLKLGISLDDRLKNAVSEGVIGYGGFVEHYGNGYAEVSRLILHYLRQGELVVDASVARGELMGTQLDNGTALLVRMMLPSEPEVLVKDEWRSSLSIRGGGSCEDAERNLIHQLDRGETYQDREFVYFDDVGEQGSSFANGCKMAMTRVGMMTGGITAPAGFLCRVGVDGGVELLRPSFFCLDEVEARDAFGIQYIKAEEQVENLGVRVGEIRNSLLGLGEMG